MLQVKVCGMREPANVAELASIMPDWIGFIFYAPSSRYAGPTLSPQVIGSIPPTIRRTGVFVNAAVGEILDICRASGLDAVQLHGNELPEIARQLKEEGLVVIRTIHLASEKDLEQADAFAPFADYFLFDHPGPAYGGSGKKFDWSLLNGYQSPVPFFLSGGIGPEDAATLPGLSFKNLAGVDINSRFELSFGLKDIGKIKTFMETIKQHQQ